jgi:hypothetical protein
MVDLLDEAQRDLHDEKVRKNLAVYGKLLFLTALLFILISTIYVWWNNNRENKLNSLSSDYFTAINKFMTGKPDEAISLLDKLGNSGEESYAAVASLNVAMISSFNGKDDIAFEHYKKIAEGKGFDKVYRDFASFMVIGTGLNAKKINIDEAISKLNAYIANNPIFEAAALEELALLYIQKQDKKLAKETLDRLATKSDVNQETRERAKLLMVLTQ